MNGFIILILNCIMNRVAFMNLMFTRYQVNNQDNKKVKNS